MVAFPVKYYDCVGGEVLRYSFLGHQKVIGTSLQPVILHRLNILCSRGRDSLAACIELGSSRIMDFQFLCAVSLQKQIITSLLLRVFRTEAARAYSLKTTKEPVDSGGIRNRIENMIYLSTQLRRTYDFCNTSLVLYQWSQCPAN